MKIEYLKNHQSKRYDLTIEENHNFYANNILVHNCQNMPWVLEREKDTNVYITEKLDGSSSSYSLKKMPKFLWFNDLLFTVCSRNVWLGRTRVKFNNRRKGYSFDSNNYWLIANKYNIQDKLTDYYKNHKIELLIQGEIIGPKIQKNKYNLNELDFYVFNVYDITNDIWYGYDKTVSICDELNLKMVPIVYTGVLNSYASTLDELLKKAESKSVLNVDMEREGIVIRQRTDSPNKRGLSFKAISNKFLLKHHE